MAGSRYPKESAAMAMFFFIGTFHGPLILYLLIPRRALSGSASARGELPCLRFRLPAWLWSILVVCGWCRGERFLQRCSFLPAIP